MSLPAKGQVSTMAGMNRQHEREIRVAFVGTDASRTGAPIALLRIVRELVERQAIIPTFVLRDGGELLGDYRALGDVEIFPGRRDRSVPPLMRKVLRNASGGTALGAYWAGMGALLRRRLRAWGTEVVYANTCHHGRLLTAVRSSGLPLICHIHEMERHMRRNVPEAEMALLQRAVDHWVTPSAGVGGQLQSRGISAARISLAPGPVPADCHLPDRLERERIRGEAYGVGEGAFAVVGCGSPSWRKGTDIFIEMSMVLTRAATELGIDVRVAWLGGDHTFDSLLMQEDIELAGLSDRVRLLGSVPDAFTFLAAADVVVSTSREDTMPLVLLEAAMAGRPIVCFAGSGGAAEIVDAGGGVAVDYLDVDAMSVAILELLTEPVRAGAMGEAGRAFAITRSTPEVVGGTVLAVLERAAAGPRARGRPTSSFGSIMNRCSTRSLRRHPPRASEDACG